MVSDRITEVIFVGLPGPTHHYGGLSTDNVASSLNRGSISNPKQAALQVLELARLLKSLGQEVAFLPPQLRPHMPLLRQHFTGDDASVIAQAAIASPALLEKASSSSAMWVANAATIAPVADTEDGVLHIVTANLFTNLHRRIEAEDTQRVLEAIFKDVPESLVHPPLSAAAGLCDEGAANHMRLAPSRDDKGLHVFVYGAGSSDSDPVSARQTLSASRAVKAQLQLPDGQALFIKQHPDAINAGVFHNDVIAVSNDHVLLVHKAAYAGGEYDIGRIVESYRALHDGQEPVVIRVDPAQLSLEEAVHTYFFNSQIVTKANGAMAIIAPGEAQALFGGKAAILLEEIRKNADNPIDEVHYADLRQSMRNGGGPACLRLRMPVTDGQLAALKAQTKVMADELLLAALAALIEKHYPDALTAQDLGNPDLYPRCKAMLAELGALLQLPL